MRVISTARSRFIHLKPYSNFLAPAADMKQISKTSTLGIIITIVLAIFMSKYGPSFKIKKDVETAVETAGQVTDVVEKLAGDVANLAGLVADQLPEDGQFKDFVMDVENIAKVAADDADLVGDVIENVGRVKKEIETAETAEQVVDIVENLAEEVNVTKGESDQPPEGERVKNPVTVDDDVAEEAIQKSPAAEEAIGKTGAVNIEVERSEQVRDGMENPAEEVQRVAEEDSDQWQEVGQSSI